MSVPKSQIADLSDLFSEMHNDGVFSQASIQSLNVEDIGAQIQEGLGEVDVDDVGSEVVLVAVMVDDSGSIRFSGNAQTVRDGHNLMVDSLLESKAKDDVLFHTRFLNGQVITPFSRIEDAVKLDKHNYDPDKGTPLYDESVTFLATVAAEYQKFIDSGILARVIIAIITDGEDCHSHSKKARDVKNIVKDLLATEMYIICAMGIDNGGCDFYKVFEEMGIPKEWILTATSNSSDIRAAFKTVSQSMVRASQGAGSFSQTAGKGFGD